MTRTPAQQREERRASSQNGSDEEPELNMEIVQGAIDAHNNSEDCYDPMILFLLLLIYISITRPQRFQTAKLCE